jgi:hypothetical protein
MRLPFAFAIRISLSSMWRRSTVYPAEGLAAGDGLPGLNAPTRIPVLDDIAAIEILSSPALVRKTQAVSRKPNCLTRLSKQVMISSRTLCKGMAIEKTS